MSKEKIKDFCEKYGISEAQFFGQEEYNGSLYLESLTSIPEGFNPTVGGSLYLESLTSIPEGFNPTVGGSLDLESLTTQEREKMSIRKPPANFGQSLGRELAVFREKMTWQNEKYVKVDGIFSEVVSHKGNIYRIRRIGKNYVEYLVTDSKGKWAHGATLKEAKADLIYKIGDRDTRKYIELTLDSVLSHGDAIEAYRVITGACELGTKGFVEGTARDKVKDKYTIREIIDLTKGQYGSQDFAQFFMSSH